MNGKLLEAYQLLLKEGHLKDGYCEHEQLKAISSIFRLDTDELGKYISDTVSTDRNSLAGFALPQAAPFSIQKDYFTNFLSFLKDEKKFTSRQLLALRKTCNNILTSLSKDASGLVFGQVQSGKTTHYIFLTLLAMSAGFDNVIVLTSNDNDLKDQTEERLKTFVTGNPKDEHLRINEKYISNNSRNDIIFIPIDGKEKSKSFRQIILEKKKIFVLKKNSRSLSFLRKVLAKQLSSTKTLIIDDEGDNASINTNAGTEKDASRINQLIKDIKINTAASYVAYTATPFANVLSPDKADGGILPKFIQYIAPGDKYKGMDFYFNNNQNSQKILTNITPLKQLNEEAVDQQIREILKTFLVDCAIRHVQGHDNSKPFVLALNLTHKKDEHEFIQNIVNKNIDIIINGWLKNEVYYKKFINAVIEKSSWISKQEMSGLFGAFSSVGKAFKRDNIITYTLNSEQKTEWEKQRVEEMKSENKKFQIIISGYKLSRGLTIDNLSFFVLDRTSKEYDVILQQARFFGYRENPPTLLISPTYLDSFIQTTNATNSLIDQIGIAAMESQENSDPVKLVLAVYESSLRPTSTSKARKLKYEYATEKEFNGRRFHFDSQMTSDADHNISKLKSYVMDNSNKNYTKNGVTYGNTRVYKDSSINLISLLETLRFKKLTNELIQSVKSFFERNSINEGYIAFPTGESSLDNDDKHPIIPGLTKQIKQFYILENELKTNANAQATDYKSDNSSRQNNASRMSKDFIIIIHTPKHKSQKIDAAFLTIEIGAAKNIFDHKKPNMVIVSNEIKVNS